jgi:hypothetical protein
LLKFIPVIPLRRLRGPNISRFILAITNLKVRDHCFGAGQLGARLEQRCLQRILVVGEMIGSRNHAQHAGTIALIRGNKIRRAA